MLFNLERNLHQTPIFCTHHPVCLAIVGPKPHHHSKYWIEEDGAKKNLPHHHHKSKHQYCFLNNITHHKSTPLGPLNMTMNQTCVIIFESNLIKKWIYFQNERFSGIDSRMVSYIPCYNGPVIQSASIFPSSLSKVQSTMGWAQKLVLSGELF